MSRRNKNNLNHFTDNLKDYIVPIIGIFIVLFLIYSFFFSGNGKKVEDVENRVGINVNLQNTDSKAKVYFSNGTSEDVTSETKLYKSEKIVVSEGRLKVSDSEQYDFNIDKLGELEYSGDKKFSILSGKVWLNTKENLEIEMKYANLKVSKNSHISFIQNEVISTIYLISGMAELTTNSGKKVLLSSKEKIEISSKDSASEDLDLNLQKEEIGDIFKTSEWYLLNDGNSYINLDVNGETEETGSGETETETKTTTSSSTDYITFNNLIDESNISGSPINIYGTISSDEVSKIVVNNTNLANIIKENKTFSIEGVEVGKKVNDLVFKVYDSANDELDKFVYTVYNDSATTTKKDTSTSKEITSNNFSADASDFTFVSPSKDGVYKSYENIITIKGKVTAKGITKVTVNGYKLKSFNGNSWMYHANKDFGNMQDGTNQYEIKYYKGDDVVYRNYFTIVKKAGEAPSSTATETTE